MARGNQPQREQTYRERALKLFPWICAHCGRDFDGKKLSQLTVHHKDHNHDNNPPDGSNWELLCSTVTTTSTSGIWRLTSRVRRHRAGSQIDLRPSHPSPISRTCSSANT